MAVPDRELWHVLSDPSDKAVGLTSTEKINNNRRPLFFFFFSPEELFLCWFLYILKHFLLLLCSLWFLAKWVFICLYYRSFLFFWSFVESGVQWSCFLWWILLEFWTALQVWVAHIWRKMSGVSAIWSYL